MARDTVRRVLTNERDPLSVLCEMAADDARPDPLRIEAARTALPYMLPRLSAMVVASAPAPEAQDRDALVDRLMAQFRRLAPPPPTIEAEAVAVVEANAD